MPADGESSKLDRVMLFITVCATPVLDIPPSLGPVSMAWLWYAIVAGYVFARHNTLIPRAATQPIFLAGAFFIITGVLMEAAHPQPSFSDFIRFAQTLIGAGMIALLCQDRKALKTGIVGMILFGVVIAGILLFTKYGRMSHAHVQGYSEATDLRAELFEERGLFSDLNRVGFLCGLGGVGALVLTLGSVGWLGRLFWLGLGTLCFLGSSMTFSRSGMLVGVIAGLVVLGASGKKVIPGLIAASLLAVLLYAFMPPAVLERYKPNANAGSGKQEAREKIYTRVLQTFPQYWLTGVGAGNYNDWAREVDITLRDNDPKGAHNSFFQVWIQWGILGVATFTLFIVTTFRALPKGVGKDPLALALLGMGAAMVLRLCFTHNYYVKDFSAIIALLAAARLWIWPDGRTVTEAEEGSVAHAA